LALFAQLTPTSASLSFLTASPLDPVSYRSVTSNLVPATLTG